ncbi:cytochrome [Streptomyces sp. NPDC002896]|uniref:cytochrome n=1 Tax=Streptomyces sp. NPDC002896 TaxID=3154438 RepID=UPI00331D9C7B
MPSQPYFGSGGSGSRFGGPPLESLPVEPLLTRDFEARPDAVYDRLRRLHGPVAPVGLLGVPAWLVLGYGEALEVLQNERLWKRDIRHWRARAEARLPADWPLRAGQEVRHMMFLDGEEHRLSRGTFETALRPYQDPRAPQARQLRTAVLRHADELIGLLSGGGTAWEGFADLCSQYSRPLPLMVINSLYGFHTDHGDEVVMDIWRMLDGGPDAHEAVGRLLAAMTSLAAAKQQLPGDDLTSRMLAADPSLSAEQLGRELFMIAVYLSDVTSNLISNTALEVIRGNRGVRVSLSAGLIGETVNRAAMANPPVANMTFRFPVQDVWMGNYCLRAGDIVVPSIAAAHRDPVFSSAVSSDATVSTRAHLAWGAGPHQCPGSARELAGVIVTTAVGRLFERFSSLELTLPPDQLPWRAAHIIRGLRSLPVRYVCSAAPEGSVRPAGAAGPAAPAAEPEPSVPDERRKRSPLWRLLTSLRR